MTTMEDRLYEIIASVDHNDKRGKGFERFVRDCLLHASVYKTRFTKIWLWQDWPDKWSEKDLGIDLVAWNEAADEYTAIQCKLVKDASKTLNMDEIAHFLAESGNGFQTITGKKSFAHRLLVSTSDNWGANATSQLQHQDIIVQRLPLSQLLSHVHWIDQAWPQGIPTELIPPVPKKTLHDYQRAAVDDVLAGFASGAERGQLIMACGTGKTFTSLKIAEALAQKQDGNARILFCVPSISLLSQTLWEWHDQAELNLHSIAVCSDRKVSTAKQPDADDEDQSARTLGIPVTTDPKRLKNELEVAQHSPGLTVVFSTYQSIAVVAEAQKLGATAFDLMICDEAHRTTGLSLTNRDDESHFVRVHNPTFVTSAKRLYMTATPRVFGETADQKAELRKTAQKNTVQLVSMDDENVFGKRFHELGFGKAIELGRLTDYKVVVLTISEKSIAKPVQEYLAGDSKNIQLDDTSRIIGCWNALAKRAGKSAGNKEGFPVGQTPMRRAVAFAQSIKTSELFRDEFTAVVGAYRSFLHDQGDEDLTNLDLRCEIKHVDGGMNIAQRNKDLAWLKEEIPEGECRILSNARCLTEGIDVPDLDAVLFLHPRKSVVDVVQAVGRVMRTAPGKKYGYVILPIAIPANMDSADALDRNDRFKAVWQVLGALRSHDERLEASINAIALSVEKAEKEKTNKPDTKVFDPDKKYIDNSEQLPLIVLSEWQDAIFARIVKKVGTREYWDNWARDVAEIAAALIVRIDAILDSTTTNPATREAFECFVQGLRDNLNDSIAPSDAISMLAQHLITKPVFDALFKEHNFAACNPVSQAMEAMVETLGNVGLVAETAKLSGFYDSVRRRAEQVNDPVGKQKLISNLYEQFFQIGFKKQAEALGVVYTPTEVVDFLLHAAEAAMQESFGKGLTDEKVHILDPFTGTGTFLARLLQSDLVQPQDLARKYEKELHANELMLLAYYIATVNIETTYQALAGSSDIRYEPFPGVVLADTFQITEAGDTLDDRVFVGNNQRIVQQLQTPINVVIGNPPYVVGQNNANDLNAKVNYPTLDEQIRQSYVASSTATNNNSLYNSYFRAYRWATNRIGQSGLVAFVTGGGWLEGGSSAGFRRSLEQEYAKIYVYNLRGNADTSGERRQKEKGNVFGSGSRSTITLFIGVKNPAHAGPADIYYRDIGDYLDQKQKLNILLENTKFLRSGATLSDALPWEQIKPNEHGDWIHQRNEEFFTWPALGEKKLKPGEVAVFVMHSAGLQTNRDAWVYNFSKNQLAFNIQRLIYEYNSLHSLFEEFCDTKKISNPDQATVTEYLSHYPDTTNPTKIKWSRSLRSSLARKTMIKYIPDNIVVGTYRPFTTQHAYFDRYLNHERSQLPSIFPTPNHENYGFYVVGVGSDKDFSTLMLRTIPDLAFWGSSNGQFFPRYTYEQVVTESGQYGLFAGNSDEVDQWGYRKIDNITDEILVRYQKAFGPHVTKDDIFASAYGQLHDPSYRTAYAHDLKKSLPRIPLPTSHERFAQLTDAGRALSALHLDYESAPLYPLRISGLESNDPEVWRVTKMNWTKDRTAIIYNHDITIGGIPEEAHRYLLGSRSALQWVIERYQVHTDKNSGIVNDPNDWGLEHDNPRYIVDLISKVVTVSVETMKIVDSLRED